MLFVCLWINLIGYAKMESIWDQGLVSREKEMTLWVGRKKNTTDIITVQLLVSVMFHMYLQYFLEDLHLWLGTWVPAVFYPVW